IIGAALVPPQTPLNANAAVLTDFVTTAAKLAIFPERVLNAATKQAAAGARVAVAAAAAVAAMTPITPALLTTAGTVRMHRPTSNIPRLITMDNRTMDNLRQPKSR